MTKLIVDCVILNYNDANTTIELINHINEFNSIDHIIIVDNCSTDDSFHLLQTYASRKIIVLRNENNGGYGAGNNFGVFYSKNTFHSDYVIIANPDVRFEEDCISALVVLMEEDKKCSLAAPIQINTKGEIIEDYAWPFPTTWQAIFSAGHYLHRVMWKHYGYQWLEAIKQNNTSVVVDCVPGAMLIIRTSDFCDLSGYDENNFLYWEEAMIGKKIVKSGHYTKLLVQYTYLHNHAVSINKNIPRAINRIKLLLKGRYHYLKNYSNAKGIQIVIAKIFFKFCIIEENIITRVKKI